MSLTSGEAQEAAARALAGMSQGTQADISEAAANGKSLTGAEKAAILLLALGEETAPIWEALDDEELREISYAMSNLGAVQARLVEDLILEFVGRLSSSGSITGNYEQTQRLLSQFLPTEKVDTLMEEIRGPAGRTMWDKLGNVSETVLANYLKNEYPQTVAVVLSKVRPDHAAAVLACLPPEFAVECMQRMLRMEPVARDIIEKIEITLRNEFMTNLARTSKRDSHELMADIFNSFDRQTEGRFMTALEEKNKESAEKIRSLMFVFDDLSKLDPGGIQTLLRAVPKDKLALALKGANDQMQDLFTSNMSERAAKILKEDMQNMGPVKLKDVDGAQQDMVYQAKELAERGEIMLADGGSDDELIY